MSSDTRRQKQHTQHGGEGKAPHRAGAFDAIRRNEERTQGTLGTLTHLTTRSGNWACRETTVTRKEGPVATTGPESHKGLLGAGEEEGATIRHKKAG